MVMRLLSGHSPIEDGRPFLVDLGTRPFDLVAGLGDRSFAHVVDLGD